MKQKLTNKQIAFCREYTKDWNGEQAARRAGYSKKTARAIACENLTKVNIKKLIDYNKAHLEELLGISKRKVIEEHMKIAFSTMGNLHDTWISRKRFNDLTSEQKACIKSIEVNEKQKSIKVILHDKQKSLESISKIMGYDAPVKMEMTDHVIKFVDVSKEYHKENDPQ